MSRRFLLTPTARSNLLEIHEFLHRESPPAASMVLARLRDAMLTLGIRLGLGHMREDLADEPLRFWPVYSYLIIYRAEVRPIQVIRVLHSSRNVQALLEGS